MLDNRSLANTLYGLHFTDDTAGGTVTGNTALDNEDTDCKDESDPLANHWTDNVVRTAAPRIICTAPTTLPDNHDGKAHDKQKAKKHSKHHKKWKKQKKHRPDPCACTLPWRF